MTTTYRIGDVLTALDEMAATGQRADLVATSPPFLLQRSYVDPSSPLKRWEHGQEPTPALWLATQLDVIHAVERVLSPWGSIAWEVGDKRSGAGGSGGDYKPGGRRAGHTTVGRRVREHHASYTTKDGRATSSPWRGQIAGWPKDKSITCTSWALAMSLAYGRNVLAQPLTAVELMAWVDEQVAAGAAAETVLAAARTMIAEREDAAVREFDPWRVRNVISWVRPNPPVGLLGDKWRDGTSFITVATKARDRWWDEVATKVSSATGVGYSGGAREYDRLPHKARKVPVGLVGSASGLAPLLDWWQLTNPGTKVADPETGDGHYACWPPEIARRLILSMCPMRVCATCEKPSRRIVKKARVGECDDSTRVKKAANPFSGHDAVPEKGWEYTTTTTGWTSCGCSGADGMSLDGLHTGAGWRPGRVLDPYGGTGTTGAVAEILGRDATLIDLNPVNKRLLDERRAEVARQMALTSSTAATAPMSGQLGLFGEGAA